MESISILSASSTKLSLMVSSKQSANEKFVPNFSDVIESTMLFLLAGQ